MTVVAELLRKKEKKQIILHLVNFDEKNAIRDIDVDLSMPPKTGVEKISILSPDGEEIESIEYHVTGDRVYFKTPKLMTYDVVLIQLK